MGGSTHRTQGPGGQRGGLFRGVAFRSRAGEAQDTANSFVVGRVRVSRSAVMVVADGCVVHAGATKIEDPRRTRCLPPRHDANAASATGMLLAGVLSQPGRLRRFHPSVERRFPKERVDHYRVSTKTATLTGTVIRHWSERRFQMGEEPEMGDVLSDSSVVFARDNGIYRARRLSDRVAIMLSKGT